MKNIYLRKYLLAALLVLGVCGNVFADDSGLHYRKVAAESDPVFVGHPAYGITTQDITDIGNLSGTNTGDQTITHSPSATFSNAGMVLSASTQAFVQLPYSGTITGWTIASKDVSGSCVVSIWKDTDANYPPTIADKISGTNPPTLTSSVKATSNNLSSWATTTVTAGDWIVFNIDSATTVTDIVVNLTVTE